MTSSVTKDHGASDERGRFERWYVSHAMAECGFHVELDELRAMRSGDGYGDRGYLNGCWHSFRVASAGRLELLEALKDCTKFMERDLPMDIYFRARPEIAKARAAIDKHEGA